MEGKYIIEQNRLNEPRDAGVKRAVTGVLIMFFIFLLIAILNDPDDMLTLFIIMGILLGALGLGLAFSSIHHYPANNTVIELTHEHITRSGDYLSTVRLWYIDIEKVVEKPNGLILFKHGVGNRIRYHLTNYPLTHDSSIIFIPANIQQYDRIVAYVRKQVG